MEKTCPRCGKVVVVSAEEVAMREGVVVCPQCLAVFDMDGNVKHDAPQGTSRHIESTQQPVQEATHNTMPEHTHGFSFCHECGKPLPKGIKFCPYCGIKLGVIPVADAPQSVEPVEQQDVPQDVEPQSEAEPKWTPVYSTYHYRERKWGTEPASLRTRIVGYSVITALLVVLAYIIYQGWKVGGF